MLGTALHQLENNQNSKLEVWFALSMYCFCIIVKQTNNTKQQQQQKPISQTIIL
jgi:hypothetical protein